MKKVLITDLDRTLLKDDETLSVRNRRAMERFRKKGNVIVVATGRNIFSVHKVLANDFPMDFLIFSSGVGIIDWKNKKIIHENHLNKTEVDSVLKILLKHKIDFMMHEIVPDNHKFFYLKFNKENYDFDRRLNLYKKFCKSLILSSKIEKASQFILILPENSLHEFNKLRKEINFLKIIRATSPLDHKSIWMEIFPKGVSKGHAASWLCNFLGIDRENTIGIGNDYNDIDLLNWTRFSFVVENAPKELRIRYKNTKSNNQNGFAEIIKKLL